MSTEVDIDTLVDLTYGNTDPERAEEANKVLYQFSLSSEGFEWCLANFETSTKEFTQCFALNTIGKWIQDQWEEISSCIPQILSILFDISPTFVENRTKFYTNVLSNVLTKLFFRIYNESLQDFFGKVFSFPPNLLSAFIVIFSDALNESDLFMEIKEQLDGTQTTQAIIQFFEGTVLESNFDMLLPLSSVIKWAQFTSFEPYVHILENIAEFDDEKKKYSFSILNSLFIQMEQQQAVELIEKCNLVPIIIEITKTVDDPDTLSIIGSLISSIANKTCEPPELGFCSGHQASEAASQGSNYKIDVDPLYDLALQVIFPSEVDYVSLSVFSMISNIFQSTHKDGPGLLVAIFERLCVNCAENYSTTEYTNSLLKHAENVFRLIPCEMTNEFFNQMKGSVPEDESKFPFLAAMFKLLKQAKSSFIEIANIGEYIFSCAELLETEGPLSMQQANAIVSYSEFFKDCIPCLDDSPDLDSACQFVVNSLLKNLAEQENSEVLECISGLLEKFLQDTRFIRKITISPEELGFLVVECKNVKFSEICGRYIYLKNEECEEIFNKIVSDLIEGLSGATSEEDFILPSKFIQNCGFFPQFVEGSFALCNCLAQAVSEHDYLYSIVIQAAISSLGPRIRDFLSDKEPIGFYSAKEFCRAAAKCDVEVTSTIVCGVAPKLREALDEITEWDMRSEEIRSVVELHSQFFNAALRCMNVKAAFDEAYSIAKTIRERGNIAILVCKELEFLSNAQPEQEIVEYVLTFAEAPSFGPNGQWKEIMHLALRYLREVATENNEIYTAAISALGEKGSVVDQALADEERPEKRFEEACVMLHVAALT